MKRNRQYKVAEEIKRIVSSAILTEMKDPRLPVLTSVTSVEVTSDLKQATIYVSALDNEEVDREAMVAVLNHAKGFFRKEIGEKMTIYSTPDVRFVYDDSIVRGMEMDELLRKLNHE